MRKEKRIQCLDRAIDILEEVARAKKLGVSELGKRLGLHVATVHNIVKTLTLRNYLINLNGQYQIGPGLGITSARWDLIATLPRVAAPYMEKMVERTGESGCITVMVGTRAELIEIRQGTSEVGVTFLSRTYETPMNLATGRLLVALGPEELWDTIIAYDMAHHPQEDTEKSWSREDWHRELQNIRKKGWFVKKRPGQGQTSSVATPLLGPDNRPLAAIGAPCPTFRATAKHLRKMLDAAQCCAAEILKVLGLEKGHIQSHRC